LYPGPFGEITAGADKNYPIDYSHLNIQGYAVGAWGLPDGVEAGPDTAVFSTVDTETEYGWDKKVRMKLPIFTGALGSTEIARVNWNILPSVPQYPASRVSAVKMSVGLIQV
jgi:hypothetical protein